MVSENIKKIYFNDLLCIKFSDVSVTSSSRYSVKSNNSGGGNHFKFAGSDSLSTISKEVIELIKMCPKSTMKFNKFIPAYHNHFGKQCRVADYGYTKLIELFEALSSIVQVCSMFNV